MQFFKDFQKEIEQRPQFRMRKERALSANTYSSIRYQKEFIGAGGTIGDMNKSLLK